MPAQPVLAEVTAVRRVFEAWSVEVPESFAETFVLEDGYWHAWDATRSVSLSSTVITEKGRAVSAERLVGQIPPLGGLPVPELPAGLLGRAAWIEVEQPARASHALSGVLAAEGRVLIGTITSDDLAWARRVWRSIRAISAPLPSRRERRASRGELRGEHGVAGRGTVVRGRS